MELIIDFYTNKSLSLVRINANTINGWQIVGMIGLFLAFALGIVISDRLYQNLEKTNPRTVGSRAVSRAVSRASSRASSRFVSRTESRALSVVSTIPAKPLQWPKTIER